MSKRKMTMTQEAQKAFDSAGDALKLNAFERENLWNTAENLAHDTPENLARGWSGNGQIEIGDVETAVDLTFGGVL
jgi:hypothetical protein